MGTGYGAYKDIVYSVKNRVSNKINKFLTVAVKHNNIFNFFLF